VQVQLGRRGACMRAAVHLPAVEAASQIAVALVSIGTQAAALQVLAPGLHSPLLLYVGADVMGLGSSRFTRQARLLTVELQLVPAAPAAAAAAAAAAASGAGNRSGSRVSHARLAAELGDGQPAAHVMDLAGLAGSEVAVADPAAGPQQGKRRRTKRK